MAYTPKLSYKNSCTLRRIAWWLNKPMTYAIQLIIGEYAKSLNAEEICIACRDRSKCSSCPFKTA